MHCPSHREGQYATAVWVVPVFSLDAKDVLLSSLAQPHLEPPQQNADVDVHSRPVTSVVALSRRRHSISRAARGDATLLAIAL
jgi:hypothetical protein